MAHVATTTTTNNNNGNTTLPKPFMDRMTHSVIKETSKSLRYYIDVKRRENAFVLNPNSTAHDAVPLKARFIYGTTKEYPPLYGSCHSDNDVKNYLRSFQQQQQRQSYSTSSSPEKQMCREELNFHMRAYKFSPRENQKFSELRLRPPNRSSSSCSGANSRDVRQRLPKSSFKLTRHQQDQLVDDTANMLASMVKARRSVYEMNLLSQQTAPVYISRNANPSPRQADDQSNIHSIPPSLTQPTTDLRLLETIQEPNRQKRTTENVLAEATSIMNKAKPITKGLLCEYKVSVTTGSRNGASTNAPIRIKFYGTNGYTEFLDLIDSETHRVPFLKDQVDVFTIQTYHVGQFAGITIGHDRKDMRSGWFLNKISIDDPIREITYDIPCNAWLSSQSTDQKTMRDFQVSSMISHKKNFDSDEHREEIESQSDYSTTATTSSTTNRSQNNVLTNHKQTKRDRKSQRVSIGPTTTVAKKSTSIDTVTNNHSQSPPATTVESHFNRNEFPPPPVPARRIRSPIITTTSSSDTEIEDNVNRSRSTTPTFDQSRIQSVSDRNTFETTTTNGIFKHHSTDHTRPPARLENRNSPISVSPERPIKSKEEKNENDAYAFFD